MVVADTRTILEIYGRILPTEKDLQVIQHIEHTAYWDYKRAGNEDVKATALKIRDAIAQNKEYQIFKVLIGYQGVFNEWRTISASREEEDKNITNEIQQAQKIRDQRVVELAESVTAENFGEWEPRILKYAQVQSDDMATFPCFAKFLELMGKKSPDLALTLLERHAEELKGFIPFLLWSVYESSKRQEAESLIRSWVGSGNYLRQVVGVFGGIKNWDSDLFRLVCNKAIEKNDLPALKQIISVLADGYNPSRKDFVDTTLADSIRKLTAAGDCGGILNIWFRKEINVIVQDMNDRTVDVLLENLTLAQQIGYEAEAILTAIAKQFPDKIVKFFGDRLKREDRAERRSGYSAIPYQFHELQKVLSSMPEKLVDAASQWFDEGYGMFIYRGGKFLKNIFPDFPERFENKLIEFVRSGEKDKQMIALAVLRNYDGNPMTHKVCKELVKAFPPGSAELNEVCLVLQSTGVVCGEYGFVEAYQRKKTEIEPWLADDSERVQTFARQQLANLDTQIDWSKKRADEDIELRKFKYGTDDDINES
jgi:tRNA nucleotidyltransferase/poly(A) polymerase